jgi:hypothetical protein
MFRCRSRPRPAGPSCDAKPSTPNLEPNRERGTEPVTRHSAPGTDKSNVLSFYFRIGFRLMYSALSVMLRNGS